jgi:hypothetical protein
MGHFLKNRSGDFFKTHILLILGAGYPNRSQEKVELRPFMTNFSPKKAPCDHHPSLTLKIPRSCTKQLHSAINNNEIFNIKS